ncbi:MAG: manganese efflux pump MntP family protein [Muribaculaceae bacterium]|nr:manganese efflux pump MntP family protein [Muribaculaceae bacterium]
MTYSILFFFNSILLGIGLSMDAFSVSLVNGLHEPDMKKHRMGTIAGVFAFFQAAMPMIGWICVHTILQYFQMFEKWIPWIALGLLLFIGGNMLKEGLEDNPLKAQETKTGAAALLIQGVATSIDALSVGFTIAEYDLIMAIVCACIIAAITFCICIAGLLIGKKFGTLLSKKASLLGGVILIVIGVEIFLTGIF